MSKPPEPSGSHTPSPALLAAATRLRHDVAATEVVVALREAEINSILLKGPTTANWLYAPEERRPYSDVDLLVDPENFGAAEGVVGGLGFRHLNVGSTRHEQESHHEIWFRELDGACLELHRSIYGVTASDGVLWRELESRTEPIQLGVGNVAVTGLTPPARAFVLSVHAAAHGGDGGKPLTDLERAIEQLPREDWAETVEIVRNVGAGAAFTIGLSLVEKGPDLLERYPLSGEPSPEMLLLAQPPVRTAIGFARLAESRGLRRKLAFVFGELTLPPTVMRMTHPVARKGNTGLVLAYLARPFVLVANARRGFRAYKDAAGDVTSAKSDPRSGSR